MLRRSASLAALALIAAAPAVAVKVGDQVKPVQRPDRPLALRFEIPPEMSSTVPMFAPGDAPLPIYLNRHGGTFYGGYDDASQNRSSIVSGSQATVGDFPGTDAQWQQVVSCVQDLFSRFNVHVTDVEPTGGDYVESVMGGSPDELGLPWGVGGVAPFDPYGCNVIPNAIVYTFADVYYGSSSFVRDVCETAAQEIAHAFSLDHELLASDPMTYLQYNGQRSFKDEYAVCGEWEPRECACGRPNQNSVQLLYEKLGAADGSAPPPPPDDHAAPTVAIVSPAADDVLDANTTIEVVAEATDDVGLTLVELLWRFSDESMPCPGSGGSWQCQRSGSTYTWSIAVGRGARDFSVRARDVVGNQTETDLVSIWLSEDGAPRPEDRLAPEVTIVSPPAGAVLPANSRIDVVVSAADDVGIARMELLWDYQDQVFPCPMESQYVSCTVQGTTYAWTLTVGEGRRSFSARATDLVGKVTTSFVRSFDLEQDAELPSDDAYEGNDTWDFATEVTCGSTLDLIATPGDDDWFVVDAPDGMEVHVTVTGEASDDLSLDARTSPLTEGIVAEGRGQLVVEPVEASELRVRISPEAEAEGSYRLVVTCEAPKLDVDVEEPPLCACADTPRQSPVVGAALVLALTLLVPASRRRR